MKRSIATAAVCGVSLFGFTTVASAAGSPGNPTPNPTAIDHTGTACTAVSTHNLALNNPNSTAPGINNLYGVGDVFCF